MPKPEFRTIEPKILYFGTPVALVSSLNEDSSTNLPPIWSFWALGWPFMLGLLDEAKTAENLRRMPECVLNLPSPDVAASREASDADKFRAVGLSPLAGEVVQPERAQEWPIQMEAKVHKLH
jgi:flavin reductase (DIM6/NTAB) family NADH-FMN oxidoreductase RutF